VSLPLDALSVPSYPGTLLSPDGIELSNRLTDYERGGIAINNPSQGINVRDWRIRYVGTNILISGSPYTTETTLISAVGVTEISLAFDQNMRPAVAYIEAGQPKLYWFDSFVSTQVTTLLATDIVSTYLTTDDKRDVASQTNTNDILLFYVRASSLFYRQQRDRFSIERLLAVLTEPGVLVAAGMNTGNRVQIEVQPA